jgi:hypothetical protein
MQGRLHNLKTGAATAAALRIGEGMMEGVDAGVVVQMGGSPGGTETMLSSQ